MNEAQSINRMSEELFKPVDPMIRAKSQFWTRFSENPVSDVQSINMAVVSTFVSDSRLEKWWNIPGFQDWFLNQLEWRELLETTAYKSLRKLDEIISLPSEPKVVSAQVQAIKLLFEAGRKMPPKNPPKTEFLDASIGEMKLDQLKEFFRKNSAILLPLLLNPGTDEPVK